MDSKFKWTDQFNVLFIKPNTIGYYEVKHAVCKLFVVIVSLNPFIQVFPSLIYGH